MQEIFTVITHIGVTVTAIIASMGYAGIAGLMVLESMVVPLPSELVMPFAGFLVAQHTLNFWLVVVASTMGSLVGSLLSYYIGKCGGEPLLRKYGKYILVSEEDLAKTEQWFQRRGERTIFISRFVPVVRHLISIPAGMGKMPLARFCIYTVLGAGLWNALLTEAGVLLGVHWDVLHTYLKPVSLIVAALLVVGFFYVVYKHVKRSPKSTESHH